MKYRKKPVVIEARQLTNESRSDIYAWVSSTGRVKRVWDVGDMKHMVIDTLEGEHIAKVGDYIIKGVKGEFYPCKPDIFEMTYEAVE